MSPEASKIRLVIQQPGVPGYRVPVFRQLAGRPGIDLRVVYGSLPDGPANAEPAGFAATFAPIRSLLGGRLVWHTAAWTFATRARADVLVLTWNVRFLSLLPALVRAKLGGVRTVLWGHGYAKREAGWRRWLRDRVTLLADALLFYNDGAAHAFVEATGCDPRKVHLALNALDQAPVQAARAAWLADPHRLPAFRADRQLGPGPVILFVSRLCPENRVDLVLEAAAALGREFPDLLVVVIGAGTDDRRLRGLAAARGLGRHVRFLGPVYGEGDLAPWFLVSDVFCYPANMGLSVLHAFGYGLPVVTGDDVETHGPEIEALRPGENGLTFAHGDAAALAAVLRRVLSDAAARQRLSRGALRTATEVVTLDRMVDGFERAVRHSLGRGTRHEPAPDSPRAERGPETGGLP